MKWSRMACSMICVMHSALSAMEIQTLEQLPLHVQASLTVAPTIYCMQTLCAIDSWYDHNSNVSRATVTHTPDITREYVPNILASIAQRFTHESDIPQSFLTDLSHQAPNLTARYKMLLALLNVDPLKRTATFQCSIYKKFKDVKTMILEPTIIQCILGAQPPYTLDLKQNPFASATNNYKFTIQASLEKPEEIPNQK